MNRDRAGKRTAHETVAATLILASIAFLLVMALNAPQTAPTASSAAAQPSNAILSPIAQVQASIGSSYTCGATGRNGCPIYGTCPLGYHCKELPGVGKCTSIYGCIQNPQSGTTSIRQTTSISIKPTPPLSVTVSPASQGLHTSEKFSISSLVSGGTTPYTYAWYNYTSGTPSPVSSQTSATYSTTSGTVGGTFPYFLKVTDATGKTVSSSNAVITVQPPPPPALIVYPNPITTGNFVVIEANAIPSPSSADVELWITPPWPPSSTSCSPAIEVGNAISGVYFTAQVNTPGNYLIFSNDITTDTSNSVNLIAYNSQQPLPPPNPILSMPSTVAYGQSATISAEGSSSNDNTEILVDGSPVASGRPIVTYKFNTLKYNPNTAYQITATDTVSGLSTSATLTVGPQITPVTPPKSSLPLNPMNWFSIALIATLLVITVAAMVYALAGVTASQNARAWARVQIYEALLSIILLLIFASFSYMFFLSPQGAYSDLGLLPGPCHAQDINTLFNLSSCDLGTFTSYAYGYFGIAVYLGFFLSLSPGASFEFNMPGAPGISAESTLPSIFPGGIASMVGLGMSALLTMLILNQVQLILLASSLLFLSLFTTMGIVARTFGFMRTFGGAMIALGIGLGLVYPLLISITYGFVATQAASPNIGADLTNAIGILVSMAIGGGLPAYSTGFILRIGYVVTGLTFVPFLNFIILDAFIVDFSKAIGERIDFMSMMSGLV